MKNLLTVILIPGFFLIGGLTDSVSSPLTESNDIVHVGDQINECIDVTLVDFVFHAEGKYPSIINT